MIVRFPRALFLMSTAAALAVASHAVAQTPKAAGEPAALQAPPGITAVAGRVVDLNGNALADVFISDRTSTTKTDALGRYLLTYVPEGASVLRIDGRHSGPNHATDYGVYEVGIMANSGKTLVLPYKHWLPLIDHAHEVSISSPTASDTVVTTPLIANFELHIPAGVIVVDADGKPATKVGITPLPAGRAPTPLGDGLSVPQVYTLQPGAACLYTAAGEKAYAQIWYPNLTHELPKARATFYHYSPLARGWIPKGTATVSADGRFLVPDAGSDFSDFGSAECAEGGRLRSSAPNFISLKSSGQ